jgi:hypothetical protein
VSLASSALGPHLAHSARTKEIHDKLSDYRRTTFREIAHTETEKAEFEVCLLPPPLLPSLASSLMTAMVTEIEGDDDRAGAGLSGGGAGRALHHREGVHQSNRH